MALKAIETRYKGYRFRSRLEARWAVFFDALDLDWQYEPEGVSLSVGNYLPDFWIATVHMWAEVKPVPFSKHENALLYALAKETRFPALKLIGVPENKPYFGFTDDAGFEVEFCLTNHHNYPRKEHRFFCMPGCDEERRWADTAEAARQARGARFEHGQYGAAW